MLILLPRLARPYDRVDNRDARKIRTHILEKNHGAAALVDVQKSISAFLLPTMLAWSACSELHALNGWPAGLNPDDTVQRIDCWDLVPEDEGIICARIDVPADPAEPRGPRLSIAVAVLPALGRATSPPLVYLEGGPGFGAIVNAWDWTDDSLARLRRGRVVVLPDQRGTGYSTPSLTCREVEEMDDEAAALVACRKRLASQGVDLADYTSANNAADIALLRRALGIETWDVMGSSYGTRLALTIVRDEPEGVRALALDGLFPPEAEGSGPTSTRETVVYALEALVNQCAKDRQCADEIPDLRSEIVTAVRWLERQADASGNDADGVLLLDVVIDHLDWPDLPWLVADLAAGDRTAVKELEELAEDAGYGFRRQSAHDVAVLLGRSAATNSPTGDPEAEALAMAMAIICTEEEPFVTAVTGPIHGWPDDLVSLIDAMGAPDTACAVLGLPPAGPLEIAPVRSELPTLIVNGILDAVTPPAWARRAADHLPNATVVMVPERGHDAVADPCVVDIVATFLDNPGRQLDVSCVFDLEPLFDD